MFPYRSRRGQVVAIHLPHHRFTVDEYHRMAEVGILREDDRVELIDGEIIAVPPIGSGHAGTLEDLADRMRATLPAGFRVRMQNPIVLYDEAESQPDLAIAPVRDDNYRRGHPRDADVMLVVEVADTSLAYDRHTKAPMYARAGIPELWIVNLVGRVVEIYREPLDGAYRSVEVARRGDTLRPLAFPEINFAVADLLV
ncbi:MAG: Uma2 family endonuclease [Chloroflexi bacterium]|nr:Uma2 family endonuclease [Chloroflexota bacterium]